MEYYKNFEEKKDFYKKHFIIDCYDVLQSKLIEYGSCSSYIFRGVNNASFKMYSSLHRFFMKRSVDVYCSCTVKRIENYLKCLLKEKDTIIINSFIDIIQKNYYENNNLGKIYSTRFLKFTLLYYIFSLLEHYNKVYKWSPFINFTLNSNIALYFATDKCVAITTDDKCIKDYVSLYIIDKTCPKIKIFNSKEYYDNSINTLLDEFKKDYSVDIDDAKIKELSKIISNKFLFSTIKVELIELEDLISNDNIKAQKGCFIAYNHFKSMPLETNYFKKEIICLDISKKLIPEIDEKISTPRNINRDSLFPNINKGIKKYMDNIEIEFAKLDSETKIIE